MQLIGMPNGAVLEDRPDGAQIDMGAYRAQWPGCVLVQFPDTFADLSRIGEPPVPTVVGGRQFVEIDDRPFAMPKMEGALLASAVKAECSRRIYDRISAEEQVNMASALPDADADTAATIRAVRGWIADARIACKGLIAAGDVAYADDGKWPAWNNAWTAALAAY